MSLLQDGARDDGRVLSRLFLVLLLRRVVFLGSPVADGLDHGHVHVVPGAGSQDPGSFHLPADDILLQGSEGVPVFLVVHQLRPADNGPHVDGWPTGLSSALKIEALHPIG